MEVDNRITYTSLPDEVKRIADRSIGKGVLQAMFSYDVTYHLLIKLSDGVIVGFALYHFKDSFDGGRVGVIDCVCVDEDFRGEGFGTLITYNVLRKMGASSAVRVEILLKCPSVDDDVPGYPLVGSKHILEKLGFRLVKKYENFYVPSSLESGYTCVFCGEIPDTCDALLYVADNFA